MSSKKDDREKRIRNLEENLCFDVAACRKVAELEAGEGASWDRVLSQIRIGLEYEIPKVTEEQVEEMIRGIPMPKLLPVLNAAINGDDAEIGKKPAESNGDG